MGNNRISIAEYIGVKGTKDCAKIMAAITPEQREVYESMARVEFEIGLWQAGLGPKPVGVIVCREHGPRGQAHD